MQAAPNGGLVLLKYREAFDDFYTVQINSLMNTFCLHHGNYMWLGQASKVTIEEITVQAHNCQTELSDHLCIVIHT